MIAAGHPYEAIMDEYTMDELTIYHEAALRAKADERRDMAVTMRVAANAGKRDWKSFIKEVESTWRRIEKTAGRAPANLESFMAGLDSFGKRKR